MSPQTVQVLPSQGAGEISNVRNTDIRGWRVEEVGPAVLLSRVFGTSENVRIWFSVGKGDDESDGEFDTDEDSDDDDSVADDGEDFGDNDSQGESDGDIQDDHFDTESDTEEDVPIECKISFSKPQMGVLLVVALATEDTLSIESISYSRDARIEAGSTAGLDKDLFTGKPKELEDTREGFEKYLADRGIDDELGSLIVQYAREKETEERTEWISNIETFIK